MLLLGQRLFWYKLLLDPIRKVEAMEKRYAQGTMRMAARLHTLREVEKLAENVALPTGSHYLESFGSTVDTFVVRAFQSYKACGCCAAGAFRRLAGELCCLHYECSQNPGLP